MGCSDGGVCLFGASEEVFPKSWQRQKCSHRLDTVVLSETCRTANRRKHVYAKVLRKETQTCKLCLSSYSRSAVRRDATARHFMPQKIPNARGSQDRNTDRARGLVREGAAQTQPHDAVRSDVTLGSQPKIACFAQNGSAQLQQRFHQCQTRDAGHSLAATAFSKVGGSSQHAVDLFTKGEPAQHPKRMPEQPCVYP